MAPPVVVAGNCKLKKGVLRPAFEMITSSCRRRRGSGGLLVSATFSHLSIQRVCLLVVGVHKEPPLE